ncbi:MAG TPA: GNAT family N-acetyltransferase, partial [Tepidisphaeraceae bacterium]|nr:GNAT family N-acetyltransferase [Tepidisphaeraceae bacterium]
MSGLSNSGQSHDAGGVECRPVERGEIESALRLILATESGLASDGQVLDFLSFCLERKIDTNATWVAIEGNAMVWAMLPVVSPGRTMLLFTPAVQFGQTSAGAVAKLVGAVSDHYARRGVQLAQMLIDPIHRPIINLYRSAGFDELAELVYLQKTVRGRAEMPQFQGDLTLKSYSEHTHAAFVQAIRGSYEASRDCPALNGVRDMDDVIAGHRATGDFDPRLWGILCRREKPVAVLLLSRLPQGAVMELVYLGLMAEARGKGIGDLLMKQAIATTAAEGRESLSLAVDAGNGPALGLYYRHGMQRIGSRVALLRDLHPASGESIAMQSPA